MNSNARSRRSTTARLMTLWVALLAAGCGREATLGQRRPAMPTTVVFASNVNADELPGLRRVLARFEEQTKARVDLDLGTRFRDQSGIKVKLLPTTPGDRRQMLKEKRPPFHLFAEDIVALRPLVKADSVQPPTGVKIPDDVDNMLTERLQFDGQQMFLPFRSNVRLLYANIVRLRQAGVSVPRTFKEFKVVASRLRDQAGEARVTLSLSNKDDGLPLAVTMSELSLGMGGDPRLLNDRGTVAAFEFVRDCWKDLLLAHESLFAKHDTEVHYLEDGDVWLAQNWSFTSSELAKADQLDDFEVHTGWQGPHVVGGDALGVPKGVTGKEREAALRLASFLMSAEAQRMLAEEMSWPSIRTNVRRELRLQSKTFRAIDEAMNRGWYRPTDSYWFDRDDSVESSQRMDVTKALNQAFQRVVVGGEPAQTVLDQLHEQVRRDYPDQYPPRKD